MFNTDKSGTKTKTIENKKTSNPTIVDIAFTMRLHLPSSVGLSQGLCHSNQTQSGKTQGCNPTLMPPSSTMNVEGGRRFAQV